MLAAPTGVQRYGLNTTALLGHCRCPVRLQAPNTPSMQMGRDTNMRISTRRSSIIATIGLTAKGASRGTGHEGLPCMTPLWQRDYGANRLLPPPLATLASAHALKRPRKIETKIGLGQKSSDVQYSCVAGDHCPALIEKKAATHHGHQICHGSRPSNCTAAPWRLSLSLSCAKRGRGFGGAHLPVSVVRTLSAGGSCRDKYPELSGPCERNEFRVVAKQ